MKKGSWFTGASRGKFAKIAIEETFSNDEKLGVQARL
jgi:hypothetical protein